MFEYPQLFTVANFFQINAGDALIEYDKTTATHTRTGYGAAYEVIRDVFENGEICESHVDATIIGKNVESVSAEAVTKDGKLTIFAINKTPRRVPFHLKFNGTSYDRPLAHRTLSFSEVNESKSFALNQPVLSVVNPREGIQDGVILLPPLSLNRFDKPPTK